MMHKIVGYEYKPGNSTRQWYGLEIINDGSRIYGCRAVVDVIDGKYWAGAILTTTGVDTSFSKAQCFSSFDEAAKYAKKLALEEDPTLIFCETQEEEEKVRLLL